MTLLYILRRFICSQDTFTSILTSIYIIHLLRTCSLSPSTRLAASAALYLYNIMFLLCCTVRRPALLLSGFCPLVCVGACLLACLPACSTIAICPRHNFTHLVIYIHLLCYLRATPHACFLPTYRPHRLTCVRDDSHPHSHAPVLGCLPSASQPASLPAPSHGVSASSTLLLTFALARYARATRPAEPESPSVLTLTLAPPVPGSTQPTEHRSVSRAHVARLVPHPLRVPGDRHRLQTALRRGIASTAPHRQDTAVTCQAGSDMVKRAPLSVGRWSRARASLEACSVDESLCTTTFLHRGAHQTS